MNRRLYIGPGGVYAATPCPQCRAPRREGEAFCPACMIEAKPVFIDRDPRGKDWAGAITMAAFFGVVIGVFVAAMIAPIAGVLWLLGR